MAAFINRIATAVPPHDVHATFLTFGQRMLEKDPRRRGLFDPAGVHRLVELDRTGQVDGGYTIFALMCIELWCRQFIDAVPQPVETGASASLHGVDQQEQPMVREETAHGPARPHGLGDR